MEEHSRMTALPSRRSFAQIAFGGLAALMVLAAPASAEPKTAAVFPFEFINSGEMMPGGATDNAETSRLNLIGAILSQSLVGSGRYRTVELAGAAPAIAKSPPLRDCQRCADEIARTAGAQFAVVGYVQKVSNLILNINIRVSDTATGQVITAASADIRGNTDESWRRGIEWLVKNRLLAQSQP